MLAKDDNLVDPLGYEITPGGTYRPERKLLTISIHEKSESLALYTNFARGMDICANAYYSIGKKSTHE